MSRREDRERSAACPAGHPPCHPERHPEGRPEAEGGARWPGRRPRRPVRVERRPLPPQHRTRRRARRRPHDPGVWGADLIVPLALALVAFGAYFTMPGHF